MANVSSSNGLEKYPKLRFKGFSEPWEHVKLSDFVSRVTRKNSDNQTDIPLTISSKDGLINQNEFFSKQVASKDMSGYYLLQRGEFAYNKSYSVGFDFGSIKRLEKYDQGALSTLYICFALDRFDSDFIKHYFDSLKWYREIYMISAEGARNHGLLNVPTEDFFATLHTLPMDAAEQRKIAEFLDLLTSKIEKQQVLVDNLKKYKRGLLSAVFSRELSFSDGQWISKPFAEIAHLGKKRYTPSPNESKPCIELEHIEQLTGRLLGSVNSSEQNSQKSAFEKGDVLFGKLRPYLKKYALPDFEGVCSTEIWVFKPTECITSEFLYYLVQSEEFINAANISSGTKMPRAEWSKVASTVFFLPNTEDQTKIVNLLMKIDKKINTESMLLEKLEQFKKASLQKLFV